MLGEHARTAGEPTRRDPSQTRQCCADRTRHRDHSALWARWRNLVRGSPGHKTVTVAPGPGIGEDRVERGGEVGATVTGQELDALGGAVR